MSLKDCDEIEIKIDGKHIDLQALMAVSICYLQALMATSIWYLDESKISSLAKGDI